MASEKITAIIESVKEMCIRDRPGPATSARSKTVFSSCR